MNLNGCALTAVMARRAERIRVTRVLQQAGAACQVVMHGGGGRLAQQGIDWAINVIVMPDVCSVRLISARGAGRRRLVGDAF